MNKKLLLLLPILTLTLAGCVKIADNTNISNKSNMNTADLLKSTCSKLPKKTGDHKYDAHTCILPENDIKNKKVTLVTSIGNIVLNLYEDESPYTVSNFMFLAKEGFYNNLIFHRVIGAFMIQGGDPTGTGAGGPGYKFADEFNNKKIVKGSIAMANAGPNTNGSQFFITTQSAQPHLDGVHTNFGEVIEGMDIISKIAQVNTDSTDRPIKDIIIKSIKIENL